MSAPAQQDSGAPWMLWMDIYLCQMARTPDSREAAEQTTSNVPCPWSTYQGVGPIGFRVKNHRNTLVH